MNLDRFRHLIGASRERDLSAPGDVEQQAESDRLVDTRLDVVGSVDRPRLWQVAKIGGYEKDAARNSNPRNP